MMENIRITGPLDRVRWINQEAGELDKMVRGYCEFDEAATDAILGKINQFESVNPLMGQNVMLSGDVVTPSMIEDSMHGLMVPNSPDNTFGGSKKPPVAEGVYGGYYLIDTYDPEEFSVVKRVAHMVIHQDLTITGMDSIGRLVRTTETTLVCAANSEIEPVEPIHAHSLEDLEGDPVIKHFDSILEAEGFDMVSKLRMIGRVAKHLFEGEEFELNKNKQRVSYLNASGLLQPKLISTRDLMFGTKDILEGDLSDNNRMFSDTSRAINFYPKMFDWSHAYSRTSKVNASIDRGQVDLYAAGNTDKGQSVMVPLRSLNRISS